MCKDSYRPFPQVGINLFIYLLLLDISDKFTQELVVDNKSMSCVPANESSQQNRTFFYVPF